MLAFNKLPGIIALSVALASTLGSAAPTPSLAENAVDGSSFMNSINSLRGQTEEGKSSEDLFLRSHLDFHHFKGPRPKHERFELDILGRAEGKEPVG